MIAAPPVRTIGLTKQFGDITALQPLSICLPEGEIIGLVGPDGAGKTTLMRLLAGLMPPTAGAVELFGHRLGAKRESAADIGYMPQRFDLYEDLTVGENLALYADLRNVVGGERDAAVARLLDFTGLARFTRRLAGRLSGGMKQKLGLACALLGRPRLLLLDEPSVGVDPISRRELWNMVRELAGEGMTILWSTAYLDEAELCSTVLLLNEGKLIFEGAPDAATSRLSGRVFLLRGPGEGRREILAAALERPDVLDGVVQGASLRFTMSDGAPAPTAHDLGAADGATVHEGKPRFEDAFVTMLGGVRKGRPKLAWSNVSGGEASMIVADRLVKDFGAFRAVDGVSLEVRRGEVFGLLGPNGAGKSTCFKMMCGLLRPSSGRALVAGLDLYRGGSQARGKIGYVAQKFALYGELTVGQNLSFFASLYGLTGSTARRAIDKVVQTFELRSLLGATAGTLPLGFKQRLALACAVMHEPPVLLLDEATSGVDPLSRREFWGNINSVVASGVTVLATTHFLDEAEYCSRAALIYQGRLIAIGTPDELKSQARTEGRDDPSFEDAFIDLIETSGAAGAKAA